MKKILKKAELINQLADSVVIKMLQVFGNTKRI